MHRPAANQVLSKVHAVQGLSKRCDNVMEEAEDQPMLKTSAVQPSAELQIKVFPPAVAQLVDSDSFCA